MKANICIPTITGAVAGLGFGLYFILGTKGRLPRSITDWLGPLVEGIYKSVASGERGPGGIIFAFLLVLAFCTAVGACLGFSVALLVRALKRKSG